MFQFPSLREILRVSEHNGLLHQAFALASHDFVLKPLGLVHSECNLETIAVSKRKLTLKLRFKITYVAVTLTHAFLFSPVLSKKFLIRMSLNKPHNDDIGIASSQPKASLANIYAINSSSSFNKSKSNGQVLESVYTETVGNKLSASQGSTERCMGLSDFHNYNGNLGTVTNASLDCFEPSEFMHAKQNMRKLILMLEQLYHLEDFWKDCLINKPLTFQFLAIVDSILEIYTPLKSDKYNLTNTPQLSESTIDAEKPYVCTSSNKGPRLAVQKLVNREYNEKSFSSETLESPHQTETTKLIYCVKNPGTPEQLINKLPSKIPNYSERSNSLESFGRAIKSKVQSVRNRVLRLSN